MSEKSLEEKTLEQIHKTQTETIPGELFETEQIVHRRAFNEAYSKAIDKLYDEKGSVAAMKYLNSNKGKQELYTDIVNGVTRQAVKVNGLEKHTPAKQKILTMGYEGNQEALADIISKKGANFGAGDYTGTISDMLKKQQRTLMPLQSDFDEKALPGLAKLTSIDKYVANPQDITRDQMAAVIGGRQGGRNQVGPEDLKQLGIKLKPMYQGSPNLMGQYETKK